MPTSALILLFVSAVLHTTWNLLLKQTNEKYISTWWAVLAGSVVFLPVLFLTGLPARETWILLAVSVCVEVVYYALLSYAYQDSDFSLVYPTGSRRCTGVDCIMVHPLFGRDADSRGSGRADHCHPGSYHRRRQRTSDIARETTPQGNYPCADNRVVDFNLFRDRWSGS